MLKAPIAYKYKTPRLWGKWRWKFIIGTGTVCTAILTPPMERLPDALLPTRVLLEGLIRAARVCWVGFMTVIEYNVIIHPRTATKEKWENAHAVTAMRLVRVAEKNGGLYIKAGQGFAAASDVLPPIYCKILRKLQDSVTPRPFGQIKASLIREFGSEEEVFGEIFEEFDEKAIAAASLAQVHRARLKKIRDPEDSSKGQEVAVKCQYFDVRQRYQGDLQVIIVSLRLAGWIFPGFDFGPFIKQCEETLHKELNFKQEAENMKRCHRDLQKKFTKSEVICPKCFDEYSTDTILMTEFIHGVRAGDWLGIQKLGLSTKEVGTHLADAFAYQLFETGFAHADPHGGNILVRPHPSNKKKVQCVILDHGLSFEIPDRERRLLADIWTFATTHDTPRLQKLMKDELGMDPTQYDMLASMFLQFPYETFGSQRQFATIEEIEKLRESYNDPAMTELLQKFPTSFLLAISSISLYRAVHKEMGNPVSRPARMLRYSLANGSDATSHLYDEEVVSTNTKEGEGAQKVWVTRKKSPVKRFVFGVSNFAWVQWALMRQWFFEKWNSSVIAFALWWDPELRRHVPDELLQLA